MIGDNVYYSICCNGHGLAQAPYVGSLIADHIVDGAMHEDLQCIWLEQPKFPPFMMMGRAGLRTIWAVDRLGDLLNGHKRRARRAAAEAGAAAAAATASAALWSLRTGSPRPLTDGVTRVILDHTIKSFDQR